MQIITPNANIEKNFTYSIKYTNDEQNSNSSIENRGFITDYLVNPVTNLFSGIYAGGTKVNKVIISGICLKINCTNLINITRTQILNNMS